MKKFRVVLIAMLMVAMLASTAFAASISSVRYENGYVIYTVSGLQGPFAQVLIDGTAYDAVTPDDLSGKISVTLTPGSHTISTSEGGSKTFTVPGAVEPTEAPVEPTETPVEPTEAPVEPTDAPVEPTDAPVEPTDAPVEPTDAPVEPTDAPVEPTDAPVQPTEAPTQAPADDDDEVPKTGDSATASYLMGGAMVLAAAYLLLRRRVHSK